MYLVLAAIHRLEEGFAAVVAARAPPFNITCYDTRFTEQQARRRYCIKPTLPEINTNRLLRRNSQADACQAASVVDRGAD